jgi:translation initiation factor 2D
LADVAVTPAFLDAVARKQKATEKAHARGAAAAAAASEGSGAAAAAAASSSSSSGAKGGLNILHAYRPDGKLSKVLFSDSDPKRYWSAKDAKQVLWDYTRTHNLDAASGQRVTLDPVLVAALYSDGGGRVPLEASKAELSQRFDAHLNEYHAITFGHDEDGAGAAAADVKFKAGPVPCIDVSVETRQGKKLMTRIGGLEIFGVDPAIFAREAQRAFSCAATTQQSTVKHKSAMEVLVQGNVASDVGTKLQQMYNIPSQLVKVKKGK